MKKKCKAACFGGTFDIPLHRGHEALIRKAFQEAKFCYIGLTSDDYVLRKRKEGVKPFGERKANLVKFLVSMKVGKSRYHISPLDNFFSPEVLDPKKGIEAIVVSEDTLPGARGINLIREDYDLKPLEIIQIETVMAKDGWPISSTRIRAREIDREGKKLRK